MSTVSIVITTFNRANLLRSTLESFMKQTVSGYEVVVVDDGFDEETPNLCAELWPFPLKYFRLNRAPSAEYRNQAVVINYGVKQASGDIIILQNAECRHTGNVINELVNAVTPTNVVLCRVEPLGPDGTSGYSQGNWADFDLAREDQALFFCGAIYKSWFYKLRGMDEDFTLATGEDNDFSHRLKAAGVTFRFLNATVQHQWHPIAGEIRPESVAKSQIMLQQKTADMHAGRISYIRNLNREWGVPNGK